MKKQNRKNERPRASEHYEEYQQPRRQEYQQQNYQQPQYEPRQQYSDYSSYTEEEDEPNGSLRRTKQSNFNSGSTEQEFLVNIISSEYSQRSTSKPMRNQPRYEQQHERRVSREPRPDSSQPRQQEWWEKKPSWQERVCRRSFTYRSLISLFKTSDRQSAVIPTLRGKPPAVPDSQRFVSCFSECCISCDIPYSSLSFSFSNEYFQDEKLDTFCLQKRIWFFWECGWASKSSKLTYDIKFSKIRLPVRGIS